MTQQPTDNERVLRLIDELSADVAHTDEESRAELHEAGIDPDGLSRAVRDDVRMIATPDRGLRAPMEALRTAAIGLLAASAAAFVVMYHIDSRASVAAQREASKAQLISPLVPALSSDDAERRSVALVVARQIDPVFAAETEKQLSRWEFSSQATARANRNTAYATRILAGLQKLELSRDPDDRKAAIWHDLLPVLLEARKNRSDFMDVALAYQPVLPLLRVRNPDVFLDSYWGELWILNILLESKIAPVVEAARKQAPEPAIVQQIFDRNASALVDRDRKAFEEAISVYENTLKTLK